MSDTPRVDAAYREINRKLQGQWCSHSPTEQTAWDIARQLERELAEAQRKLEVWSLRYAGLEVLYLAAMKS